MREILFKAKRKDNNEWVYGYYYKEVRTSMTLQEYGINEMENHYIHTVIDHLPYKVEVIPETICQYTGLTDKNGVKIFENDIVEAFCGMKKGHMKGIVKFDMFNGLELKVVNDDEIWHFDYLDNIEVTGNIFDKGVENEQNKQTI